MKKHLPEIIIISLLVVIIGLLSFLLLGSNKDRVIVSMDSSTSRTIMIYMAGSDLESDYSIASSDLAQINPSNLDLENINILLYTGGTLNWHNFISNDENAIYKLEKSGFKKVQTYRKLNMGDASTFSSFLDYAYETYETDEYDLIIYDHGGAIDGAVYDDYSHDNLTLDDFEKGLSKSHFNTGNKMGFVLFRTCLNGTLEVANIFKNYAKYMIASEEITNGAKDTSVLKFLNDITVEDTAVEIGQDYITGYHNVIKKIDPTGVTVDPMYSIIDLSKVDEFTKEYNNFIKTIDLEKNINAIVRMRSSIFQYGYSYYGDSTYDTIDLYTFMKGLSSFTDYDTTNLFKLFNETVIYNNSALADSHGLSIYFPYRSSFTSKYIKFYNEFDFNKDYLEFIKTIQANSLKSTQSSFKNLANGDKDGKEFSLSLTDKQVDEFAEGIYLIFKKEANGYYMPIYSSDNMTFKNNKLTTNINNNLVKVTNASGKSTYLLMIERNTNDKHVLNTTASLFGYRDGEFVADSANVYFTVTKNKPKVTQYIDINDGVILKAKDYDEIDFTNTKYKIFDSNGKYMENWVRQENLDVFTVKTNEKYTFSLATLDASEYTCIFKIVDVYGNVTYARVNE